MKNALSIIIVVSFVMSGMGQGFLYSVPFSFSTGTDIIGEQFAVGIVGKSESVAFTASVRMDTQNTIDSRRPAFVSMPFGIGVVKGDFIFLVFNAATVYNGRVGIVRGVQVVHMKEFNNRLHSFLSADVSVSGIYPDQINVGFGFAWKLGE